MTSLEWATWVLAVLTGLLAIATIFYAIINYKILKSSKKNQELLEEQNSVITTQNNLLKEQTEALRSQAKALFEQADALRHVANSISNLPHDAQEIEDRKEKNRTQKK